ncbi:Tn3 family transposase [Legionella bozemanae]|nr:Tn3 family transposase [Legionella bozemanae]
MLWIMRGNELLPEFILEKIKHSISKNKEGELEWSLSYDRVEKLDDSFFRTLPQVKLPDTMMFMGDFADMWCVFTHMKTKYKKKKPFKSALNACILGDAFGIKPKKMAEMSDMSFNLLRGYSRRLYSYGYYGPG